MKKFNLIVLIITALFFIYIGIGYLSYGLIFGWTTVFVGLLIFLYIFLGQLVKKKEKLYKLLARISIVTYIIGFIFASVASIQILSTYKTKEAPADSVMIVLGCGLSRSDRTSPSLLLSLRLKAAIECLNANEDMKCVVAGGQGFGEDIPEALSMYNYLVEKGIDGSRIYMEDKSTSTNENIGFSKKIMEDEGLIEGGTGNVVIATDGFHEFRAHNIAKEYGLTAYTCSSKTPSGMLGILWVREICAIITQVWL